MAGRKDEFGANWWAKKWNGVLEDMGLSNRLQRGRNYARVGNVLNVKVESGVVEAQVRGSRPRPYKVRIEAPVLSDEEWENVIKNLAAKAIFSAKLLSGEMPENIEEAFEAGGTTLFPTGRKIHTSCSCPDIANPCKHIAAVYYILGQEFDADPFFILQFRGRSREQIIEALRKVRAATTETPILTENKNGDETVGQEHMETIEDVMIAVEKYNGLNEDIRNMSFSYTPPSIPYSVIKMLGVPEAFSNKARFAKGVEEIYDTTFEKASKLINR